MNTTMTRSLSPSIRPQMVITASATTDYHPSTRWLSACHSHRLAVSNAAPIHNCVDFEMQNTMARCWPRTNYPAHADLIIKKTHINFIDSRWARHSSGSWLCAHARTPALAHTHANIQTDTLTFRWYCAPGRSLNAPRSIEIETHAHTNTFTYNT